MQKYYYSLLFTLTISFNILASPLQGNYTIDTSGVTGGSNFKTWLAFQQSIVSNGVSGNVYIDVLSDENSSSQIVFGNITGVSISNQIVINAHGKKLTADIADAVILFNGADYITIDSLRLTNSSSNPLAIGIRFRNSSDYNTITRCLIEFSGLLNTSGTNGAYIAFADAASSLIASISTSAGVYNTFQYNIMRTTLKNSSGPSFGILLKGNAATYTSTAQNNTVRGNLILNFSYIGIYMYKTNGNHLILNDISRMGADSTNCSVNIYGIYSQYAASKNRNNRIDSNHIHDLPKDSFYQGGSINTLYGIYTNYIYGNDSLRFSISRNLIQNLYSNQNIHIMNNSYNYFMDVLWNTVDNLDLPIGGTGNINFYGIYNSYIFGSYKVNNNTIKNCDGGYYWYGIQNYYPAAATGVQQINGNTINNNLHAYYYKYNIYSYYANNSDSLHQIEIKGNHIFENSTDYYYTYNISCQYYGDYVITDNIVEKNVSNHYYMYGLYLSNYGVYHVERNIIRGNVANLLNSGIVYGIYSYSNYDQHFLSNLIVENVGYGSTYGIYIYSGVSGNYSNEMRQNTIAINAAPSGNFAHSAYPVYDNLPYSSSLNFIGNIIEVINSNSLYVFLLTYSTLNVDYNSYHVSNVISQSYSTTADGSDSSIAGWINLNLGSNELNAVNGHYFDSTTYATKWFMNQDNVPSVSNNLLDVYSVARNTNLSDRGAVEYSGVTSISKSKKSSSRSTVYPNPNTGDELFILNSGNEQEAIFYDINGKVVHMQVLDSGMNSIQVDLLPGIYFVYLNETGEALKFVVQ